MASLPLSASDLRIAADMLPSGKAIAAAAASRSGVSGVTRSSGGRMGRGMAVLRAGLLWEVFPIERFTWTQDAFCAGNCHMENIVSAKREP